MCVWGGGVHIFEGCQNTLWNLQDFLSPLRTTTALPKAISLQLLQDTLIVDIIDNTDSLFKDVKV